MLSIARYNTRSTKAVQTEPDQQFMTEKTGRDEFYLFVNLFEELELILERLSSVLGVDVQKRLIVQILQTCNEPGMTNSFDRLSEIYHIGPDV